MKNDNEEFERRLREVRAELDSVVQERNRLGKEVQQLNTQLSEMRQERDDARQERDRNVEGVKLLNQQVADRTRERDERFTTDQISTDAGIRNRLGVSLTADVIGNEEHARLVQEAKDAAIRDMVPRSDLDDLQSKLRTATDKSNQLELDVSRVEMDRNARFTAQQIADDPQVRRKLQVWDAAEITTDGAQQTRLGICLSSGVIANDEHKRLLQEAVSKANDGMVPEARLTAMTTERDNLQQRLTAVEAERDARYTREQIRDQLLGDATLRRDWGICTDAEVQGDATQQNRLGVCRAENVVPEREIGTEDFLRRFPHLTTLAAAHTERDEAVTAARNETRRQMGQETYRRSRIHGIASAIASALLIVALGIVWMRPWDSGSNQTTTTPGASGQTRQPMDFSGDDVSAEIDAIGSQN